MKCQRLVNAGTFRGGSLLGVPKSNEKSVNAMGLMARAFYHLRNSGSSYRLYSVSKAPNGHVEASVRTYYDNHSSSGPEYAESASSTGAAVEITGTIPYPSSPTRP